MPRAGACGVTDVYFKTLRRWREVQVSHEENARMCGRPPKVDFALAVQGHWAFVLTVSLSPVR